MNKPAARACRGVALLSALLLAACDRGPRLNLLLVTFDTTRADFIGCYGKQSARTPTLDRLAAEGTLFENCLTPVPITTPSHSTMFTGLYPLAHGVRDNGRFRLPAERTTLAELLKAEGYATGAAVGAFPLTRDWGLDQGFDFYDDHITVAAEDERGRRQRDPGVFFDERPASRVNDAMLPWLRANARRRFFAFVHYWDPHQPHVPPPPFSDLYPHDLYQGEIAYADQALGVLLDELERQGVYDRTVVAMLGDHGEGRGEHQEDTHSMLLYKATLHVPLIVRIPGEPGGRRVAARVGTVDLMPTLLEVLGLPVPDEVQGRSLLAELRRATPGQPALASADNRPYYAETLSPRLSYGWGELRALFLGPFKYVHGPRRELFDTRYDPQELTNLAPGPEAERMHGGLEAFVARNASAGAAQAVSDSDPETRARLAALGYISAGGEGPIEIEEELREDGDPPQEHIWSVSLWSQCKQALQRFDYLSAREHALRLVEAEPDNAFFRALLGTALIGLGQEREAAEVAEQGPINPQNDYVYLEAARLLFSAGDHERAMGLAGRVAAAQPSAAAHFLLGAMVGELGDRGAEEKELRAALALDPSHARSRQRLAVLLAEAGRFAEAETELRLLAAESPLDPSAHLNLATLLLQTGRREEARGELRRALDLAPDYCRAHLAMLALHLEAGEESAAEAAFGELQARCRDPRIVAEARGRMESPP